MRASVRPRIIPFSLFPRSRSHAHSGLNYFFINRSTWLRLRRAASPRARPPAMYLHRSLYPGGRSTHSGCDAASGHINNIKSLVRAIGAYVQLAIGYRRPGNNTLFCKHRRLLIHACHTTRCRHRNQLPLRALPRRIYSAVLRMAL